MEWCVITRDLGVLGWSVGPRAGIKATMEARPIGHVIMGAGIALDDRLAIVKHAFETSTSTTVHMKDWDSGPGGMLPFVNGLLTGLASAKQLP